MILFGSIKQWEIHENPMSHTVWVTNCTWNLQMTKWYRNHKMYMKSPDDQMISNDQMISKIYKIHCSIRVQPHLHSTFSRAVQPTNRTKAVRWSWAMLSDAEPSWSSVEKNLIHMAFMGYLIFMIFHDLVLWDLWGISWYLWDISWYMGFIDIHSWFFFWNLCHSNYITVLDQIVRLL